MFGNIENSVWHAFDYISAETGRVGAPKSKLKVVKSSLRYHMIQMIDNFGQLYIVIWCTYDISQYSFLDTRVL